jgi:type VI secretion system protein ImpE
MTAQLSRINPTTDHGMPLDERIAAAEMQIRTRPAAAEFRWALFQLLCVTGHWERAIGQLQVFAQLCPEQTQAVQVYRDLIRAELWRAKVIAGRERPGFVFHAPSWVEGLIEALRLSAAGQIDAADQARYAALDRAPLVAGQASHFAFDWIGDSDSRFGPVCEVVTAGRYRWLPFSDLAAWKVERPATLLDLVWVSCTWTLRDGTTVCGFVPARYPGAEDVQGDSGERDAIRLGRKTEWRESGTTGVIAHGRKTWTTSAGDLSLFQLAGCEFSNGASRSESNQQGGSNEHA